MIAPILNNETVSPAAQLAALGHPVRWAMVRELAGANGAAVPVSEMAKRLGVKRAALSSHLPQMLRAGVLMITGDAGGDGRKRCLALPTSATVRRLPEAVEVDWGAVVVRFPMAQDGGGSTGG